MFTLPMHTWFVNCFYFKCLKRDINYSAYITQFGKGQFSKSFLKYICEFSVHASAQNICVCHIVNLKKYCHILIIYFFYTLQVNSKFSVWYNCAIWFNEFEWIN